MAADFDAIAIGAGHNALVAANMLAERGWSVLVLEEQSEPGGAVKSGVVTEPWFVSDLFSSFYPLAFASPALRALELERHGLRWRRAPLAVAHPQADGTCAVISTDLEETAASVERFAPGDGAAWRELYAYWRSAPFMDALLRPFPPVRDGARIAARLGPRDTRRFLRFALLPVRPSPRSTSAAKARHGCWPPMRSTPTSHPSRPAVGCSAGSCAVSHSNTASRPRKAAQGS